MSEACVEIALKVIPEHVANHVLHHFSPHEGHPAGAFVTHLMAALDSADPLNRQKLGYGFPTYALAFHIAKDHPLGTDALRSIVAQSSGV